MPQAAVRPNRLHTLPADTGGYLPRRFMRPPVTSLTAPAPAITARTAEERTSAPRRAARTLVVRAVSSVMTAEAKSLTVVAPIPDPRHLAPTVPRLKHLAKKYAALVAVQATAPQSPRHRKLTMTSPVASWTAQPSVSCAPLSRATQKPLQSTSPWQVATSTSTPNSH